MATNISKLVRRTCQSYASQVWIFLQTNQFSLNCNHQLRLLETSMDSSMILEKFLMKKVGLQMPITFSWVIIKVVDLCKWKPYYYFLHSKLNILRIFSYYVGITNALVQHTFMDSTKLFQNGRAKTDSLQQVQTKKIAVCSKNS